MFDERIEAGVLRDDVEERGRILVREHADVVGDVEVQGVRPGRLQEDVLGACALCLMRRLRVSSIAS
jgi:hypothetical protein